MVQIGKLSWLVQVKNAKEQKRKAEEVGEKVEEAKESMEEADEGTEGLSDKLEGLKDVQETAGKGFDKMNAKAGFFGTALSFVMGALTSLIGLFTSLSGLLLAGGIIAALVALAIAWKANIGDIQGRVSEFVDFLGRQFEAAKKTVLEIWRNLVGGFKAGGGDLKDLKVLWNAVLDGLEEGLGGFWDFFQPIWNGFMAVVIEAAKVVGYAIGAIIDVLAHLEKEYGIISNMVKGIVMLVGAFAMAWAVVQVVAAIIAVIIGLIGVLGSVLSAIATVIGVIVYLYNAFMLIVSIVVVVIASLNPLTLIILALIAIIVALYVAWENNWFGIQGIVADVVAWIEGAIDDMIDAVDWAIDATVQAFDDFLAGTADFGSELIEGIVTGVEDSAHKLVQAVKDVVDDVSEYLPFSPAEKGPLALLDQVGSGFIQEIVDGVKANASAVKDAIEDVAGAAAEYLPFSPAQKGPLSNIDKSGGGLVRTVATGIEDESSRLTQAAEGAAQNVQRGFSSEAVRTERMARRGGGGNGGGGSDMKKVEINVGGVEIGDQTLDISSMTRADLRALAQAIAKELGDDVRSVV